MRGSVARVRVLVISASSGLSRSWDFMTLQTVSRRLRPVFWVAFPDGIMPLSPTISALPSWGQKLLDLVGRAAPRAVVVIRVAAIVIAVHVAKPRIGRVVIVPRPARNTTRQIYDFQRTENLGIIPIP